MIVVEQADDDEGLAGADLSSRVRDSVEHPVAAVLTVHALPVDIRHNTKIDRTAVAAWAERGAGGQASEAAVVTHEGGRMKVLVTGGTSLLARRTAETLLARGDDVTVLQRHVSPLECAQVLADVRDADAVHRAVDGCDAVIHAAAKVGVVGTWDEYRSINVDGTANVMAAARFHGISRVVYVSTPSVAHAGQSLVGVGAEAPVTGRRGACYAESKALAEQLAMRAGADVLPVVAVRPHLVWGPGDTQLVGRIVERARAGRLALVGDGAALIDTTYIDGAASALVAALDAAVPGAPLRGPRLRDRQRRTETDPRSGAGHLPCRRHRGPAAPRAAARGARRRLGGREGVVDPPDRRRATADPVPGRAAGHRALVRPAPGARRPRLDTAGLDRRRPRSPRRLVQVG